MECQARITVECTVQSYFQGKNYLLIKLQFGQTTICTVTESYLPVAVLRLCQQHFCVSWEVTLLNCHWLQPVWIFKDW
jgi:hypothetical protein